MPNGVALQVADLIAQTIYAKIKGTVNARSNKLQAYNFYYGLVKGYPTKLPPTPLCKYCENAFWEFTGHDEAAIEVVHNGDFLSIEELARAGCIICAKIVERLNYKHPPRPEDLANSVRLGFFKTKEGAILLSWVWARTGYNLGEMSPTTGPLLQFGPRSGSVETTEDALPLCKAWLGECTNWHTSCHSGKIAQLPSRLICISKDKVYLKDSKMFKRPKYATLSHCWGKLKFTTLTRSNISSFQTKIPPSALPKTFQDAIKITRYLGLEYLWIDSLCIIQDDPEDWAKESSLMTAVYSGSHINIAASGARDASVGCFFAKSGLTKSYVQGSSNAWFYIIQPNGFRQRLTEAPLSRRAWAMQERFLSPRTIFFTEKEVFWECHKKFVSETDPQSQYFHAGFHDFLLGHKNRKQRFSSHLWPMVVHWYTKCELTMARDKLVAISGIAKLFALKMKDSYVVGMWRKDLELQLCWSIENNEGFEKPMGHYIAPSWSWASTVLPVRCSNSTPEVEPFSGLQIEDLIIQYETSDQFGQIKSANLQMSCLALAKAQVTLPNSHSHSGVIHFERANPIYISVFLDWDFTAELEDYCYILPLAQESEKDKTSGLVLVPTREKNGQYRRIGMFNVWFGDCSKFKGALQNISLQNEEEECILVTKQGEKKRYWIELV